MSLALFLFPHFVIHTHTHHHFIFFIDETLNFAFLKLHSFLIPIVFAKRNIIHTFSFSSTTAFPRCLASPRILLASLIFRVLRVRIIPKQSLHVCNPIINWKFRQGVSLIRPLLLIQIFTSQVAAYSPLHTLRLPRIIRAAWFWEIIFT